MPVEMIRQDVQQQPDVRAEVRTGFQLERTDFDHQPVGVRVVHRRPADRKAVVAARHCGKTRQAKGIRQHLHHAAFAVAARHRQCPAAKPAPAQFQFGNHRNAPRPQSGQKRPVRRPPRTDHRDIEIFRRDFRNTAFHFAAQRGQFIPPGTRFRRVALIHRPHRHPFRPQQAGGGRAARPETANQCLGIPPHGFRFSAASASPAPARRRRSTRSRSGSPPNSPRHPATALRPAPAPWK